jgi:hypothetical protein
LPASMPFVDPCACKGWCSASLSSCNCVGEEALTCFNLYSRKVLAAGRAAVLTASPVHCIALFWCAACRPYCVALHAVLPMKLPHGNDNTTATNSCLQLLSQCC